MPPAKNKNESGGNWRPDDEKDKLQAVVITDSFNRKFTPITYDMPRVKLLFFLVKTNFIPNILNFYIKQFNLVMFYSDVYNSY